MNKSTALLLATLAIGPTLSARDLQDLSYGSSATFEVLTWNIEWFPKNGQTTISAVGEVIQALDVDVMALQEINDTAKLQQLVDTLPGFEAYYESSWPAGLAYVYKSDTIQVVDAYEIYTTQPYWSAFPRSPMVMELKFDGHDIVVINNHYKCCGDGVLNLNDLGDEETRRYTATNLLKTYIDTNLAGDRVIVLGDLNDDLADAPSNNVFQGILGDSAHYDFVDLGIASGSISNWSYPGWPSHLDHILITDELFGAVTDPAADVRTIRIDDVLPGGWSEYDSKISDHRPVAMKIPLGSGCPAATLATETVRVGSPPNPSALLPGVTGSPVIGSTWDPVITHTTFLPTAVTDFLILAAQPANLPSGPGTFLCDVSGASPFLLLTRPAGTKFMLPIPADCGLVGLTLCAQGASTDASSVGLTNALDFTIGTYEGN